jgi:LmbE family N-acetylglucosaminyl deacetylase
MRLNNKGAEIFVPDAAPLEEALRRTTHAAIAAHQDDIEIMAYHGILQCFGQKDQWFLGATVTDGAGSPRDGIYARFTDAEMQQVRKVEQKKAATVGEFSAVALLDYPSAAVKDPRRRDVQDEIRALLEASRPATVYTHNLADKHDTHVAVALRTIGAIRDMPADVRPRVLYGCEVWRDLDWLLDSEKVAFDVSARESLAAALVGVFDSQICGGKRYDLATLGRRRAHATYYASHGTDTATGLSFAMDLTPLIEDPGLDPERFAVDFIRRFQEDVSARIRKSSIA